MAKDQFAKFREATLGTKSLLSEALNQEAAESAAPEVVIQESVAEQPAPVASAPTPVPSVEPELNLFNTQKVSKNADRRLVSFHIPRVNYKLLGAIKLDYEKSYDDLYNEAIEDLLRKYGKR